MASETLIVIWWNHMRPSSRYTVLTELKLTNHLLDPLDTYEWYKLPMDWRERILCEYSARTEAQ